MPRGLSTNAKAYSGPFVWAAVITLRSGAVHSFAGSALTFLGATYLPYLAVTSPVRIFRGMQSPSAAITLLNADNYVGGLMRASSFVGAACVLKVLLLGIEEEVELARGRLSEPDAGEMGITFQLADDVDAGQIQTLGRAFIHECSWRFGFGSCGHRNTAITITEQLAERTATAVGEQSITDGALSMTVDAHKDRVVLVTSATTGRLAVRRIASNTATALALYQPWQTKPTGTVKWKIFSHTNGLPKALTTSSSAFFERTATGGAARYIEDTNLALTLNEHAGEWVYIRTGTGSGQLRKIGDNTTGGRFNLDAGAADFNPVPDATSIFQVLFAKCPKDAYLSCEQRGRLEDFNGFPTLSRYLWQQIRPRVEP